MITLLTGQPGHGKSLRAIELGLQAKAEGREVFACRIRGLDLEKTGFKELDALEHWEALPDGSFVIVDECWQDIPARAQGAKSPMWEANLATHRHRGFDFVLVTQAGTQISTFVRALINDHTHVRRKFGYEVSTLLSWDRYQAAPSSNTELKEARKTAWRYPKHLYGMYKSAEVHTVKKSLPWQVYAIPVLLALVGGAVWLVFHRVQERAAAKPAAGVGGASATHSPQLPQERKPLSVDEWLAQYAPRVAGMPWSAPWHDGAKPRVDPDILCVMSEAKGCQCYTEQITRLKVPILQCMQIAKFGIYNPFRDPPEHSLNTRYPAEKPTKADG